MNVLLTVNTALNGVLYHCLCSTADRFNGCLGSGSLCLHFYTEAEDESGVIFGKTEFF